MLAEYTEDPEDKSFTVVLSNAHYSYNSPCSTITTHVMLNITRVSYCPAEQFMLLAVKPHSHITCSTPKQSHGAGSQKPVLIHYNERIL